MSENRETIPFIDLPYFEIRSRYARSHFSDDALNLLNNVGDVQVSVDDPNKLIPAQISKAKPEMLLYQLAANLQPIGNINDHCTRVTTLASVSTGGEVRIYTENDKKLWLVGSQEPRLTATKYEPAGVATRLYIGLDPKKSTDAFFAFVKELANESVLNAIQLCLNIEETREPRLSDNSIVVYIQNTTDPNRMKIVDSVLKAYKRTKQSNRNLFDLGDQAHQDAMLLNQIGQYKAIIDRNLSFVEQVGNGSWDTNVVQKINDRYAFHPMQQGFGSLEYTRCALEHIKASPKYIWNSASLKVLTELAQGGRAAQDGTILHALRHTSAPAIYNPTNYRIEIQKDNTSRLVRITN